MKNILIAGGSGLVGKRLVEILRSKGNKVRILSRTPKGEDQFFWDPEKKEIDEQALDQVQVLINLSGAGIADMKWTPARKAILQNSRVGTNVYLHSLVDRMPELEHYICASGINSYGFKDANKVYVEEDTYGSDYLSQLVKVWELSADLFKPHCKVSKIRTAIVLDSSGGALNKMLPVIKMGIGSPIGSGKQFMPWIHSEDLVRIFAHVIDNELEGTFNALSGAVTNREFMKTIAKTIKKPFWFPNVPSFVLRMMYGEMSLMLLYGVKASNQKICSTGFEFKFKELDKALQDVL